VGIDDRHRDKNGEISRKHGNTLVSTFDQMDGWPPVTAIVVSDT
jgi:hypothetical protein